MKDWESFNNVEADFMCYIIIYGMSTNIFYNTVDMDESGEKKRTKQKNKKEGKNHNWIEKVGKRIRNKFTEK